MAQPPKSANSPKADKASEKTPNPNPDPTPTQTPALKSAKASGSKPQAAPKPAQPLSGPALSAKTPRGSGPEGDMGSGGKAVSAAHAALIECHYYDGGLQTRLLPKSKRPEWLPAADAVGLPEQHILGKGEMAVMLMRFDHMPNIVTWVGLYIAAEDSQYGARSNYEAVGVWLNHQAVADPDHMFSALRALLAPVSARDFAEFSDLSHEFLRDALPLYCVPAARLPKPLSGMPLATSGLVEEAVFTLNRADKERDTKLRGFLLQAQFISRPELNAPRLLVILSDNGGAKSGAYPALPAVDFNQILLKSTPDALSIMQQKLRKAAATNEQQKHDIVELQQRLGALTQEHIAQKGALEQSQKQAEHFEKMLCENEDYNRHIALYKGVQTLSEKFDALRQETKSGISGVTIEVRNARDDIISGVISGAAKTASGARQSYIMSDNQASSQSRGPKRKIDRYSPEAQPGGLSQSVSRNQMLIAAFAIIATALAIIAIVAAFMPGNADAPAANGAASSVRDETAVAANMADSFACIPTKIYAGAGPIECRDGRRITLAGIFTREVGQACNSEQSCPDLSWADARVAMARLVNADGAERSFVRGSDSADTAAGASFLRVSGKELQCMPQPEASTGGDAVAATCRFTDNDQNIACALIDADAALPFDGSDTRC